VVWIDQEFILLCCTEDTAKDLARQLDKPIDDKLDAMAYRPGDASKQPWKLDIGSHLLKSIHIEDYCNQDFISVSGKGLSSDDVAILEDAGFSYRFADGEDLYKNQWSKPKEYSDEEKIGELFDSLTYIADSLDSEDRNNSWGKDEIKKAKKMAEELPDLFVENGHLLSPAVRTEMPEIIDLFMAQKPPRDIMIHLGNLAWSDDDQPLGKFISENGISEEEVKDGLLVKACKEGDLDKVRALLNSGADINWNDGICQLHACGQGQLEVAQFLHENGADYLGENSGALCWAANDGHLEVVKWLIELGIPISGEGLNEDTRPLFNGIEGGNIEVLDFLLDQGADPRETYGYEGAMRPIHSAISEDQSEMIQLFCQHHTIGETINQGASLDISGPHREDEYEDKVTPLMLAVINESSETTQLLIRNGADLNMMDDSGRTALDHASRDANTDLMGILLSAGADPNLEGPDGQTPLSRSVGELISKREELHEVEGDEDRMTEALKELAGPKFALDCNAISLSDDTPALGALEAARDGCVYNISLDELMQKNAACRQLEDLLGTEVEPENWASWDDITGAAIVNLDALEKFGGEEFPNWMELQNRAKEAFDQRDNESSGLHAIIEEELPEFQEAINELLEDEVLPHCEIFLLDEYPVRDCGSDIWGNPWKIRLSWEISELYEPRPDRRAIYESLGEPDPEFYGAMSV
jgi:ankyrin repeat protein